MLKMRNLLQTCKESKNSDINCTNEEMYVKIARKGGVYIFIDIGLEQNERDNHNY
jgi:hypothetical protein